MTLLQLAITTIGCLLIQDQATLCLPQNKEMDRQVAGITDTQGPKFTGNSIDVLLTAEAALVWDMETGKILYGKNEDEKREVASISKLLSSLAIREILSPATTVEITADILPAQRAGANIRLPIGEHATAQALIEASLIASANDAMVALAVAAKGSEEEFVDFTNEFAARQGLLDTRIANSTGLSGGIQYSTALDVKKIMTLSYNDEILRPHLSQATGTLTTFEGNRRQYKTTNQLAGTYMPTLAAKTGYTHQAKQNLVMITVNEDGVEIGAVILGSDDRFQDMKILVEWIWRNYTW